MSEHVKVGQHTRIHGFRKCPVCKGICGGRSIQVGYGQRKRYYDTLNCYTTSIYKVIKKRQGKHNHMTDDAMWELSQKIAQEELDKGDYAHYVEVVQPSSD